MVALACHRVQALSSVSELPDSASLHSELAIIADGLTNNSVQVCEIQQFVYVHLEVSMF